MVEPCCERSHPVLAASGAIVCGACGAPVHSVATLLRERDALARAVRDYLQALDIEWGVATAERALRAELARLVGWRGTERT